MMHSPISRRTAAALALFVTIAALPGEAQACGGFFCSRSPVDQTAEHILFTVNDDHTVTAYVQIQYVGDKDDFAWIVPAPGIPHLSADFPTLALLALDTGTEPRYFKNSCGGGLDFAAPTSAGSKSAVDAGATVTVLARQAVGPFDTVTLTGTSADAIVKWLQDNGYRITDKMIPFLKPYLEGGMHFVAVRLQADKAVTDIKPLGMTYDADKPMIPIRLTAIAAQPEMGIVTWILSDRRWAPENYIDLMIPDSLIQFDRYGYQSNYLTVVSRETDKVGGQAFVTEYAKSTSDLLGQVESQPVPPGNVDAQKSKDALLPLLGKFPYITRLYARMSAEEMLDDPMFMVSSNTTDVSNVHDLTDPGFTYASCGPQMPPPPPPCEFAYCGRRGVCVSADAPVPGAGTTAPTAACVCASDATARVTTTGQSGQPSAYCEPVRMNLDDGAASGGQAPLVQPACEGFDCGAHGACVPMNGNPTCQCEAGYGAIVARAYPAAGGAPVTKMSCQKIGSSVPALPVLPKIGQTKLPEPSPDAGTGATNGGSSSAAAASGGGCSTAHGRSHTSHTAALLLALSGVVMIRRPRRLCHQLGNPSPP